jgi:hypothetical protein
MTYSELAKQVEENPTSKMIGFGGHILLTNDFFFNDGDDSPVAVMLHHGAGFVFFDQTAAQRRDERLARLVP